MKSPRDLQEAFEEHCIARFNVPKEHLIENREGVGGYSSPSLRTMYHFFHLGRVVGLEEASSAIKAQ
jgi:hypothetical protein